MENQPQRPFMETKKRRIQIFGAGGHCYAVIALINHLGEYTPEVVFDDTPKVESILGVPVRSYKDDNLNDRTLCISIGNNLIRKKIASRVKQGDFPSFIHSSVSVYPSVRVGKGTVILPNSVIDSDVIIGDFCIINNNATVSHNVRIENYVHVAIQAAVAGGVKIGEGSMIGAGAVVLPELEIGKWSVIGAGSVVTRDVPDSAVVYGNPAKIIRYNKN